MCSIVKILDCVQFLNASELNFSLINSLHHLGNYSLLIYAGPRMPLVQNPFPSAYDFKIYFPKVGRRTHTGPEGVSVGGSVWNGKGRGSSSQADLQRNQDSRTGAMLFVVS